jgi:zinc transporter 1
VAGILIWKLHSPSRFYADPAVSLGISLIIFASAIPMSAYHVLLSVTPFKLATPAIKAGRILLEAAPVELDLDKVREDLLTVCYSSIFRTSLKAVQLPEVISIHDMHVWILSHSYV